MKVNKNTFFVKAIYMKIKTSNEKMFNMKVVGDILRFPKIQNHIHMIKIEQVMSCTSWAILRKFTKGKMGKLDILDNVVHVFGFKHVHDLNKDL